LLEEAMQPQRAVLTLMLALAGTGFLTSCQKAYHKPNERYLLVATNIQLPYWAEAAAGFMDAAGEFGVKAEVMGPHRYDPQQELETFKKAVASNPSGILLSPALPQIFVPAINAAIQRGIPVITMDSDAPASRRILFIGTNNVDAGSQAGRHLAELLHGEGDVVIIAIPGQLNQEERLRGAEQALGAYPKIKVIAHLNDQGRSGVADDEVSNLLDQKKKIDGILALEASGGAGAAEVMYRLSIEGKIKIVAFDKSPETLEWISKGVIAGTVAQKPYTMGYYGLTFLDDLHHNAVRLFKDWRTAPASPLPALVITGTAWVNSSNVGAFKAATTSSNQASSSM
jgi:ribose transport system substrate-binding protein